MSFWFLSIFSSNFVMEICKSWDISRLFSYMISPSLESIPAKEDKVISFCTPFSVTTELSESTNWEFSLSISTECSGSNTEWFSFSVSMEVSVLTYCELSPFSVSTAILVSANSFSVSTEAVDEMTLSVLVVVPLRKSMKQARETTLKIQESLSPTVVTNIAKRYISFTKESSKNTIYSKKNTPTHSWQLMYVVDGVPASTSTKRQSKTGQVQHRLHSKYIHSALAAQNCTAQKHNSACRSAPIVVSRGKGTGNTNQYTQGYNTRDTSS